MTISLKELSERMEKLEREHRQLLHDHQQLLGMFVSQKAGICAALAAVSATLRELPDIDDQMLRNILATTLQGWPLEGIPDNEENETSFAAPLRFLIQEHKDTRAKFRTRKR